MPRDHQTGAGKVRDKVRANTPDRQSRERASVPLPRSHPPCGGSNRKELDHMAVDDTARGAQAIPGHEPPLSIPEAAEFLNVTDRWVRRAVRERRLPYVKVGRHVRFMVEDLRAYLAQSRVQAASGPDAAPGPYLRRVPASAQRRPAGSRPGAPGATRSASA